MSKLFNKVADEAITDKSYMPMRDKDYLDGMKDCENGWPHDMTRSLEYTDGFRHQLEIKIHGEKGNE